MNKETVKKLTLILFVTLVSFFILAPVFTSAAGLVPCGLSEDNPNTDWDETTECDLCGFLWLIKNVMDLILKLGGTICFLIVVSGAILLLVAGGSENFIAIGKKILTSAIIGLVIILSSWLIISAIFGATGYNYADNWYEFECEGPAPPIPTYLTCENGACVEKDGDKDDECKTNENCRHRECKGMVCETINQPGTNTCDKDKDCYHLACDENFDCVKTEGKGTDECSPESSKCPSHLECARYGKCILVAEGGPNQDGCTFQDQTCSAWHLDCDPISLICEKKLGGGKDRCEVIDTRCRIYYLECREGFCTKIWDIAGDDECEKEGEPCETKPACNDGEDNDGDKRIDFPDDPGCTSKDDNSEKDHDGPQCDNGRDDDGDNKIDYKADDTGDPECTSPDDNDEANGEIIEPCTKDSDCELGYICKPLEGGQKGCVPGCREDPDCPSGQICVNGECKDGCRDCRAGQKPVCYKRHDRCPGGTCTEFKCCAGCVCECRGWDCVWIKDYCYPSEVRPQCNDGEDNDKDGYTDKDDRACHEGNDITEPYHPEYDNEGAAKTTQCCDGQDNDEDGKTDYPQDPECSSLDDDDESNGEEKTCDEQCGILCGPPECHGYTGLAGAQCHFENGTWKDHCWECIGGSHPVSSCSDYLSKESCEADICNVDGCSWEGGSCVGGEGPVITFAPTSRPWANTDVSVSVTASDTDGVSETYYCWTTSDTCTPNKAFPNGSSLTQALEDDWNLCIRALDSNGIETTDCSGKYQIDKTLPRVESLTVGGNSSDFTTTETSLSIAWKVTDSGNSGLAEVQVKRRTGGGAWTQIYTEAASGLTDSGSWTDNVTCDYIYEYGLHVLDVASNKGIEVSTITATVNCLDSREFLGWHLPEADIGNPLKQKVHASEDLKNLLSCMDSYLSSDVPREISSISGSDIISDDGTLGSCDPSKCSGGNCSNCPGCSSDKCTSGNCSSCTGCFHSCNSCHYGGASCGASSQDDTGFSYAVDFKEEGYCKSYKTAAEACSATAWVNRESNHVHISVKNSDCKCNETDAGNPCKASDQ